MLDWEASGPSHGTRNDRPLLLHLFAAIVILAVVFLAFHPVLSADFVRWDDHVNLLENDAWRGFGIDQIRWMFTTTHLGPYQPLTWISWALDYRLAGLSPGAFHRTNLFFHAATAVGLYILANQIFGIAQPRISRRRRIVASLIASLLFAAHPLRCESVCWITERRDVLSGFFFVFCLALWFRWTTERSRGAYVASIGLALLSLLSKAWGMVLPAILLVLDFWPLGRLSFRERQRWAPLVVEKLPFLGLSLLFGGLAFWGQHSADAQVSLERHGIVERIAQVGYGLVFYPWKTLIPTDLVPIVPIPEPFEPFTTRFIVPWLLVIAVAVVLWRKRRRVPAVIAAVACYTALIAPVLGITQTGPQLVADRYSYLSAMPFALLIAGGMARLPIPSLAMSSIGLLIILVLSVGTYRQAQIWHDTETLWRHAVRIDPQNPRALSNLGKALETRGSSTLDATERVRLYREALVFFERGEQTAASMPEFAIDSAVIYEKLALELPDESEALMARARAAITRGFVMADALGVSEPTWVLERGIIEYRSGNFAASIEDFESVVTAVPDDPLGRRALALALLQSNRIEEALPHLQAAARLDPGDPGLQLTLGRVHDLLGQPVEAKAAYGECVRLASLGGAIGEAELREATSRLEALP